MDLPQCDLMRFNEDDGRSYCREALDHKQETCDCDECDDEDCEMVNPFCVIDPADQQQNHGWCCSVSSVCFDGDEELIVEVELD